MTTANDRRPAKTVSVQMSDKLYHGDVTSIEEALTCLVRGLEGEIEETRQWNASLDANDPEDARYRMDESAFATYHDTAQQALSFWLDEQQAAKQRLIERLRALGTAGNEDATTIADALEAEAWDALAW
jgi:hypothetical protein